jgi:hypothetical protein
MIRAIFLLLLLFGLAACAPVIATEPEDRATTDVIDNATLHDAQAYADEMGVSVAEALSRLEWQNSTAIGDLQNQLESREAATFAGLWLQHEPEYRVVVAFTRDGTETIGRYVTADSPLAQIIEVRPARYSYAQLLADQQTVMQILDTIKQPANVDVRVMENRVILDVTDRAALQTALAAANVNLPESVVINTIYEPVGDNPPFAINPVPDVTMPQLRQRDAHSMLALLVGELVVQDGCLRVQTDQASVLVIWQADYFLTDNDGLLEILDETGQVVAQVGETVHLGGGMQSAVDEAELRQAIPVSCPGPYWRMGRFLPEEYIP